MTKLDGFRMFLFCSALVGVQSVVAGQAPDAQDVKSDGSDEVQDPEAAGRPQLPPFRMQAPAAGGTQSEKTTQGGQKGLGNLLKRVLGTNKTPQRGKGSQTVAPIPVDENEGKIAELRRQAIANFERKRLPEAIRNISDLITLKPYDADYHLALALSHRSEGKYAVALQKYQEVLDLGGPKPLVALLKAEVYAAENNKEKAYEMLKEAALGGRNIINDVQNLPLLEPFQNDTEFIKLALQLERFAVDRRGHHDPFTNLFPRLEEIDSGRKPGRPDIDWTPERQQKLLRKTKKVYEQIQFYIKIQDEKKAMDAYLELKNDLSNQRHLTIPKIMTEFRIMAARLQDIEVAISGIRLRYYYSQAKEKIDVMKELFDDGDYARVVAVHQQVENLAAEMQRTNPKYNRVANEILTHARRLVQRATIRLEFESQRPKVQGIIISGDAKATIINDRVVKQGESMAGFRVLKVESNRITFQFKGEEIPLIFRRY